VTYEAFVETAERLWAEIPEEFKRGLQGLHILEEARPDPEEPGLLRLGEYHDPGFPSVLGGFEGIGRHIALFYGSFAALAAEEPGFDWEEEIWETLLHELRHHLESLAWRNDLVREDLEFLRRYRRQS
jgi:hypothetical protein